MVLEKTLESPLDCKEIQPVHSKRDQSWVMLKLDGITDLMDMSLSELWEMLIDREACSSVIHGVAKSLT